MKVHEEGSAGTAYAGVGSRSTPAKVLQWMEWIGRGMAEAGMVLRSGAADGADSAFERGCDSVGGDKRMEEAGVGVEAESERRTPADWHNACWRRAAALLAAGGHGARRR